MQPKESKTSYHFLMSLIKSGIRIVACVYLVGKDFFMAGALLGLAECIGIAEEM